MRLVADAARGFQTLPLDRLTRTPYSVILDALGGRAAIETFAAKSKQFAAVLQHRCGKKTPWSSPQPSSARSQGAKLVPARPDCVKGLEYREPSQAAGSHFPPHALGDAQSPDFATGASSAWPFVEWVFLPGKQRPRSTPFPEADRHRRQSGQTCLRQDLPRLRAAGVGQEDGTEGTLGPSQEPRKVREEVLGPDGTLLDERCRG